MNEDIKAQALREAADEIRVHTWSDGDKIAAFLQWRADKLEAEAKKNFTNMSTKRHWTEDECRLWINAALLKLINDAGGRIVISTAEILKVAVLGTLALSLSDDDKLLTVTRVKVE